MVVGENQLNGLIYEPYHKGKPSNHLFFTVEAAQEWIQKQPDYSEYTVEPYSPW